MLLVSLIALVAIAGFIAFPLRLADVRRSASAVMSAVVRDRGIRPSGPNGTWLRRDRLIASAIAAVGAALLVAAGLGAFAVADRWPGTLITGVGFVTMLLGMMAGFSSVLRLVRAPFAPAAAEWS